MQDGTGAILLRLGGDAGRLRLGQRVEVDGSRSTFGGMESLRVTDPARSLGTAPEPAAREMRTGDVGEGDEALLVVVRGAIVASARRWSSGTVSFEIDDGSGPLRISIPSSLRADRDSLGAGSWVEVRGVVGQETSGSKPNEGYRVWPRARSEVRVTAPVAGGSGSAGGPEASSGGAGSGGSYAGPTGSLDDLGTADLSRLRIGATIVVGPWKEMRVGGLLWDGARLVAVAPIVQLARRAIDARTSPALRARPRRPPGCRIRCGDWCADGQARFGGRPDDSTRCRSRGASSQARRRSPGLGLGRRSAFGAGHTSRAHGRWRAGRPSRPLRGRRPASTRRHGGGDGRRHRGSAAAARPVRRHAHRPRTWPPERRGPRWTAAPKRPDPTSRRPPWPRLRTCDDRSSPASSWRRRSPSWAARPLDGDAHRTPSRPKMRPSSRTRRRRQRTSRSCRCRARADRERERGVYSRAFIDRAYARREAPPS